MDESEPASFCPPGMFRPQERRKQLEETELRACRDMEERDTRPGWSKRDVALDRSQALGPGKSTSVGSGQVSAQAKQGRSCCGKGKDYKGSVPLGPGYEGPHSHC